MTTHLCLPARRICIACALLLLLTSLFIRSDAQAPEISFHRGVTANEMNTVRKILYGNGIYLTVGSSEPLRVYTSSSGDEWERIPGPPVNENKLTSVYTY